MSGKTSRAVGFWILTILPFASLVAILLRYTVDLPFQDQWDFVPVLERSYQGTMSLGDLWIQHNEHRDIFPRLLSLALAHATAWNGAIELALNLLLAVGIFILAVRFLKASMGPMAGTASLGWISLISLLVFSMNQSENWLGGGPMPIWLNVFSVMAGIVLLSRPTLDPKTLAAGFLAGVVATFSFANGLIYWPIAFFMLRQRVRTGEKRLGPVLGIWMVLSLMVFGVYFQNYHKPVQHPSLLFALHHPVEFIHYTGTYLGAPLAAFAKKFAPLPNVLGWQPSWLFGLFMHVSCLVGLTGLAAFFFMSRLLTRNYGIPRTLLVPFQAMVLYALGSALVTGVARAGFGRIQAMSLRYVTISTLLWIANTACMGMLLRHPEVRTYCKRGIRVCVALIALFVLINSANGLIWFVHENHALMLARNELVNSTGNDARLICVYPDPKILRERAEVLRKLHVALFRKNHA